MDALQWNFREMMPREINSNPMERELIASGSSEAISERLVREVIQNSLDASLRRIEQDEGLPPVRVRFSLRGVRNPLDSNMAAKYTEGISPHLAAGLDEHDDFRAQAAQGQLSGGGMTYLVVEDAGTAGLEGDWRQFDDEDGDDSEDNFFYWFFRNVGRSGKSGAQGGSWGIGKWVLPDASQASAFIAVTCRRSDNEVLLMGQNVLTKHTIDGKRYPPYGYFGLIEDDLDVPLRLSETEHRPVIERFIQDFGLQFRDEPGLSVVIPFPRVGGENDLTKDRIAAAVVHNYFYPIIAGRLEVIVDDDNGAATEITTDTIDDVLHHIPMAESGERSMSSYQRLFDMCREAATLPDTAYVELSAPPQNSDRYGHFEEITNLQGRYREGELLAFRITTSVRRKGASADTPTTFRLLVQHDDSLKDGHDYYVRGWLSLSDMDDIKKYPARALLVVDQQDELAELLRDSEPPAHTHWRPQYSELTKSWTAPKRHIEEVMHAPKNLLAIWEAAPVPIDRDAFADIFPDLSPGNRTRPTGQTGPPRVGPIKPPPPPPPSEFVIQRSGVGFSLQLSPNLSAPPQRVHLQVAYEIPRGSPLSAYSPHDFTLHGESALDVVVQGCSVSPGEKGNELIIAIEDSDSFSLVIRGFDPRRDIFTKVQSIQVAENVAQQDEAA